MRVRVLIRPKAGILDPQGQTVERALPALGFEGVSNVHVGRLVELDVDDPSRVAATTSSGIAGAGGVLSQPVPEAQSRTYCLSKLG